jgi:hypothetical protein
MRIFALVFGVPAALAFMAASMACNANFLTSLSRTAVEFYILIGISIAVDIFKSCFPFWTKTAVERKKPATAFICVVGLVLSLGLSFLSAIGFAAGTRGAVTGGREVLTANMESAKADLTDALARLKALPEARPTGVIDAEINRQKQDRFWAGSKGCAEASGPAARGFCKGVETLRAELASAVEAERLREKADKLKTQIAALKNQGAGTDSDPQASVMSRYLGLSVGSAQSGVSLLIATLVELCAAFGLYIALTLGKGEKPGSGAGDSPRLAPESAKVKKPAARLALVESGAAVKREAKRVRL